MKGREREIPILTLWQPWATLIVDGVKDVENRPRPFPSLVGRDVAIHAGKKWGVGAWEELLDAVPPGYDVPKKGEAVQGAILGIVRVRGMLKPRDQWVECLSFGAKSGRQEPSPWWDPGSYGLTLEVVRKFEKPVSAKGKQGVWYAGGDMTSHLWRIR